MEHAEGNKKIVCGVGSAWRHYHRKENEDPAFSVGDYYGSGVFPGVADRIGTAEPWADIGYAAYRADTGDVHGSRDDRGNGQLILLNGYKKILSLEWKI